MPIAWRGDFLGNASLARVNRELARAMIASGGLEVLPLGEPTPAVEGVLGLPPRRREDAGEAELVVRHRWPPYVMNPRRARYVHIQPWEMGAAPRVFADALIARADDVWCYSTFVARLYRDAGLPAERVHVVPLGVDPAIFHPGVEPLPKVRPDVFSFLFVGGTTQRKGVPILIDAYTRAFRAAENVELVIKDIRSFFSYPGDLGTAIRALVERRDIPAIRYLDLELSDAELARLYRGADVLVHPYRGEGFGLTVLEAMACGTPAIVSTGGATDDFISEEIAFPVPARRLALGNALDGVALASPGWLLDVDPAVLAAKMRETYEQRATVSVRGRAAAAAVHAGWTWGHAARVAVDRVAAVLAAPPQPALPIPDALDEFAGDGDESILGELFARLRLTDPVFVEAGVPEAELHALLAERWNWRAVAPADAPRGFDLLSIPSTDDAAAGWEIAAAAAPRVVRSTSGAAVAGYTLLARDRTATRAYHVRDDLVARTEFGALSDPMPHRPSVW